MKTYDILIIGGGVSGIAAAIFSKGGKKNSVLLLEKNDKPGKKILSTGNGRCNFTNKNMDEGFYNTSGERDLIIRTISSFSFEDCIKFMKSIGIYPVERFKDGFYYPSSMQAISVRNALIEKINSLDIDVKTECEIVSLKKEKGLFLLTDKNNNTYYGKRVICTTGGKAAKKSGSDGAFFKILKEYGHNIIPLLPALTGIRCEGDYFKELHGVRTKGRLRLKISCYNDLFEDGEIQFIKEGISGIPVFQLSSVIGRALYENESVSISIDLFPDLREDELRDEIYDLIQNAGDYKEVSTLLDGFLPYQLSNEIIKRSSLKKNKKLKGLKDDEISFIIKNIKEFIVIPKEPFDFDSAQVTSGGVSLKDIDPGTIESKKLPGLYFAGEVMDVDGLCGGYNMHFALASGYVSGKAAGGE